MFLFANMDYLASREEILLDEYWLKTQDHHHRKSATTTTRFVSSIFCPFVCPSSSNYLCFTSHSLLLLLLLFLLPHHRFLFSDFLKTSFLHDFEPPRAHRHSDELFSRWMLGSSLIVHYITSCQSSSLITIWYACEKEHEDEDFSTAISIVGDENRKFRAMF